MHDEGKPKRLWGEQALAMSGMEPDMLQLEILNVKEHKDETQSFSDLNASSRL
jgi:hypothetical protein